MKINKIIISASLVCIGLNGFAQEAKKDNDKSQTYANQSVNIGYDINQTLEESTSSVSIVKEDDITKRSAKDVSNSLYGYGLGLMTLENSGTYASQEPTFYIRGLQSSAGNNPLILVDGIERDMSFITPEEVKSVTILKDAAAVALYGYKGINGAINVVTKRGRFNSKEIQFSYDQSFNWQERLPKFVNAYTYANAVNEALTNDGSPVRYSSDELNAFKTGQYPYLYPNVNWINSTFKDLCQSNKYNIIFRGGGSKLRYFTLFNLNSNNGFIAHPNMNSGYSTQDKYSKANLRINLDIDLTDKTSLVCDVLGTLSESSTPGDNANLWNMIYTVPAAAFPVKLQDNTWGGNVTWPGTSNPVAMSEAAAYAKERTYSSFTDMILKQDLSPILKGLQGNIRMSYDNIANVWEDHSKTFVYGSDAVTSWLNGAPATTQRYTGGTASGMNTSAGIIGWTQAFNLSGSFDYNRTFNVHKIYSQLKWDYEYRTTDGLNNTWYRQNVSMYTHYGYKDRYYGDVTMVASESNQLAPGHKWAFSPTVSAAWILSKENFLKDISWVNLLKLRASFGIINSDRIPYNGYWQQAYGGGSYYPFDTNYSVGTTSWTLGQLASLNSTNEKSYKYNVGVDATLFHGLDMTIDAYYQRKKDIWVPSSGKYSSILGFTPPYENGGIVDDRGIEVGANYSAKAGNVTLNIGANFTWSKNKIVSMLEQPQMYPNLVQTGSSIGQVFGLKAIGFFKDQADINNSPTQSFGTVEPGDIKYKDVNGDGKIDGNDKTFIGYSTLAPEIYYSFHLGAEWQGLGFDAMFQGTANYSAVLYTQSVYWPLINNTNISQYYYDNRWTPNNLNAKFPRLSAQSNTNNYQTSSLWVADRSFLKLRTVEIYYNLPKAILKNTKIINNVKLYIRGIDLLCFDHIKIADPESYGATNPLTRSAVAGINVAF